MKIKLFIICLLLLTSQVFAEIKKVDNQEIIALMKSGIPIIDIRTADEWKNTGVIQQSHLLTFFDNQGNHNTEKWMTSLKLIANKNDPVILICRSGRRSGIVAKILEEQENYTRIYDASSGMVSWINSKHKTFKPN